MFEFHFNGKLWCVDAAKEDGSLGRLVNDDHINPNAKMKYLTVQGKPHLCLFAIRDIGPREEITYYYGDSDWPWRSKKSGGVSSDVQHGEVPSTSKLSTRTQNRSTHKAQRKMPTRASAGRLECFNKMTTERGQIEMTASNLNQTSPVLDALTRIGQEQQFSECTEGELSSDLENMSDKEYVPDSESQEDEDNEDSDARVPFMYNHSKHGQIQVNPAIPDVRASKVSDTSFPKESVPRDFYRLPVNTTRLAKILKLLLTMEKGHLSSLQWKSLDEIRIEGWLSRQLTICFRFFNFGISIQRLFTRKLH